MTIDRAEQTITKLDVSLAQGCVSVVSETGVLLPVIRNRRPLAALDPGWTALHVVSTLAPTYVMVLRHEDGHEASWFLNADMHHIGGGLQQAVESEDQGLRPRILSMLKRTLAHLNATRPGDRTGSEIDRDIASLCDRTIFDLIEIVWAELFGRTVVLNLDGPETDVALQAFGLSRLDLLTTLDGSLPDGFAELFRTGTLERPSPFGTGPAASDIGLLIENRITAYRFLDRRRDQVFHLIAHDYHDRTCAIYFPTADLYCHTGHAPNFRHFSFLYVLHVVRHAARIAGYLSAPEKPRTSASFVSDFPALHLGHVVWNELSGLLEIAGRVGRDRLPDVYVLNAENGSEPFGKIDLLFPEYRGRVVRPSFAWDQAAAHVYENRLFFVRYMTRYVRREVGRRIMGQLRLDHGLDDDRRLARRFRDEGRHCMLLGLRVGNRTVPDLDRLYSEVIDHLVGRLRRVVVVIEGHNARIVGDPTTSFGSFGPPGTDEPLVEELRIVFALRRRYQHDRNVEIVSVVGTSIARGLFWIEECRFFVAPWGASLAKYRWICNKPGFVMTNRLNISEPAGDLLIYNSPQFMEDPAYMEIIDLHHVQDVPGPGGFYANFIPSTEAVLSGVDRLIKAAAAG